MRRVFSFVPPPDDPCFVGDIFILYFVAAWSNMKLDSLFGLSFGLFFEGESGKGLFRIEHK